MKRLFFRCWLLAIWPLAACAQAPENERLVLASLAPLYQLTLPLVEGTDIDLRLLPDSPRGMSSHGALFIRRIETFADAFSRADAVISLGSVWAEDPLYISARQYNIRVVDIDAGKPYSHELDGVTIARSPVDNAVSPYVWLSPSNVVRMIDIIGRDLRQLYPDQARRIASNMEARKNHYRALKAETEQVLLTGDPVVYSLADEFIYLTRDLTLFVDGWFVKQDIDWTAEDHAALTRQLQDHDVKVVIHKWQPSTAIVEAIEAAGAELVVLDTLETTDDFAAGLEQNLAKLAAAIARD